MGNRYDADWQGVALALRQLKDIAAPSELDILEKKQDFAAEQTMEQRQYDEKQKGYERAHSLVETMVEKGYETWTANQAKITTLRDNILKMDAGAEKLVGTEHETPGFGIVFEGLNLTKLEDTMSISKNIEENIAKQLKTLGDFQQVNNNQNLGKQIYDQGKMDFKVYKPKVSIKEDEAGWDLWQEKTKDYEVLIDEKGREYKQVEDWDFKGSAAGVEEWEYNAAITNIQREMEDKGEDARGLDGGFWQGFKNEENESKLATIQTTINKSKDDYRKMIDSYGPDNAVEAAKLFNNNIEDLSRIKEFDVDVYNSIMEDESYAKKFRRLQETVTSEGMGHLITNYDPNKEGAHKWHEDVEWYDDAQEMLGGIYAEPLRTIHRTLSPSEKVHFNYMMYNRKSTDPVIKAKVEGLKKKFTEKFAK